MDGYKDADKSTQQLLALFFETLPENTVVKNRAVLDNDELYAYEERIEKHLVDMNPFEIGQLVGILADKGSGERRFRVSRKPYANKLSWMRKFFKWYIDSGIGKPIENPCDHPAIIGRRATEYIFDDTGEPFTRQSLEEICNQLYTAFDAEYAEFYELILRLFYEGFPKALSIASLKESDLNFSNNTAFVNNGVRMHLSDRTIELLKKNHSMESREAFRGEYLMVSSRESYLKYPTRRSKVDKTMERSYSASATFISQQIARVARELATEYGVKEKNKTHLKTDLRPFITNLSPDQRETILEDDILDKISEMELRRIRSEEDRIRRNQKLVSLLKELYDGKCQLCGENNVIPPIIKEDGSRYSEVHHINPVSSIVSGDDYLEIDNTKNAIVVCPFHHTYLHRQHGGRFRLDDEKKKLVNDASDIVKLVWDRHLNR